MIISDKPISLRIQILLYAVSGCFFIVGLFGFMQIGWLLSRPISEFSDIENSKEIVVPREARAFMVNHGNYIFFEETPGDNPEKTAVILACLIVGIGTSMGINSYIVIRKKKSQKR